LQVVAGAIGPRTATEHRTPCWQLDRDSTLHAIFPPGRHPAAAGAVLTERRRARDRPDPAGPCQRHGGEVLLGDGGHASHGFAAQLAERDATSMRPCRKQERGTPPHLAPVRQRIESIFWTRKDLLTLQRHRARTLARLKERVPARFCRLAAAITPNHQPARNSRALDNHRAPNRTESTI
jgi:hypothetical protein